MPNFTFSAAPSSDTLTLGVVRRSAEETFPETIQFQVTDYSGAGFTTVTDGEYNEELHLEHFWSFDDSYSFTAPTQNVAFAVSTGYSAFANAGSSRVPKPAHTYRAAGTYSVTVSVWGYVSGILTEATGSISVTVGTPDFSGTNTIYVDPDGTYATKPTGAQEAITLNAAVALLSGTTPKRIMLRSGVTHTITSTVGFNNSASARTVLFVSETAGTKVLVDATGITGTDAPALSWLAPATQPSPIDWIMQDIELFGARDPSSETHGSVTNTIGIQVNNDGPNQILFDRCTIRNFGVTFFQAISDANASNCHSSNDTIWTAWTQFGMYDFGREAGLWVGSRINQDVDAYSDLVNSDFLGEAYRGGAPAGASVSQTVFDKCDIFNRVEDQGLRINTNGNSNDEAYIFQNVFEANRASLDVGAVVPAGATDTNTVINGNIFIGTYDTPKFASIKATGVTAKNNIFFCPTSGDRTSDIVAFLGFDTPDSPGFDSGDAARPVRFFSNSVIALGDGFNPASEFAASPASFVGTYTNTLSNNSLNHQPGITGGPTVSNLETTSRLTPKYKGFFESTGSFTAASPDPDTTSDDNFATYAPLTGSSAIGAASSGVVASHDFFGNNRVAIAASHTRSPSTGAIEPDLAS